MTKLISDTPVFGTPALHETHTYGTHACQLIHCLKTTIHSLCQQRSKLLVVEYLQIASYITHTPFQWPLPREPIPPPVLWYRQWAYQRSYYDEPSQYWDGRPSPSGHIHLGM